MLTEKLEISPVKKAEETTKSPEKSSWIKIKPVELEKMIIDLVKQGNTPAKIGLNLRDKNGIPKARLLGKKITHILKEAKISYTSDKEIVAKKIEKLKLHKEKNKYDHSATRSLAKQLWLLHRLEKQN